ncbi:SOS response-associated peptidase family protein [Faecalibaculum rodentium]|jgi:putative SOS response-associated peptidase YedK|uniref:SOS response-associated peptidase family protein n=2 Tax=Faecalibaculum rodentium TaxID=1702221 RepID=UPI002585F4ED|nr:SOS response-associated peptidase family protein [Faecalibaculum rodentium]
MKEAAAMCGRFQMTPEAWSAASRLASIPSFIEIPLGFIYPGTLSLVLTAAENHPDSLTGELAKFGWKWKADRPLQINARSETAWTSPLFGPHMRHDRAVIPASCFFEWTPAKEMISCRELRSPVLYMAGFVTDGSFVILTTKANDSIRDIHHRMPLVLREDQVTPWIRDEAAARRMTDLTPPEMITRPALFEQPRLF